MRYCQCKNWETWIPYVKGFIDFCYDHAITLPNGYVQWEFCPWCGDKLKEKK